MNWLEEKGGDIWSLYMVLGIPEKLQSSNQCVELFCQVSLVLYVERMVCVSIAICVPI